MRSPSHTYFPVAPFFMFVGFLLTFALLILVELHLISFAFEKLGIPPRVITICLLSSLLGSVINIPVARLKTRRIPPPQTVMFYGMRYRIPEARNSSETIVAVNLGGAIIPVGISLYLLFNHLVTLDHEVITSTLLATAIVTIAVHNLAFRIEGVGIAVPTLIPPIIAILAANTIAPEHAAPVAYIAGTLGTLIGADLMNLSDLDKIEAPVISIGGAGTSDGIFLTGIIAVLLS